MKIWNRNKMFAPLGIVFLMSFILSGCQVEDPKQIPMPEKPYILKHDSKTLTLHYQGRNSKLSPEEEALLLSSMKPSGPGKVSVHITLPNKGSSHTKQRVKHIIRTLLATGVKSSRIHKSDAISQSDDHAVEVILDTYRAIPPLCPNWSMTYGPGYDRGTTSNFGCATAVNFLLMIEDPIILFRGEHPLSHDAARDSLSIADHRVGKDKGKWLKAETTSSGASGGSGSATPGS
jgi:pilus biogenesis lipoprotein CpaD